MPSPSLLLRAPPLSLSPSHSHSRRRFASPSLTTSLPAARFRLRHLRLPHAASRHTPRASARAGDDTRVAEDGGLIPIARCYEGRLARLELAGAARREQAVAAAAAADGGARAEAHLAAGSDAMVVEAFLPGPHGGGTTASSTRVVLGNLRVIQVMEASFTFETSLNEWCNYLCDINFCNQHPPTDTD